MHLPHVLQTRSWKNQTGDDTFMVCSDFAANEFCKLKFLLRWSNGVCLCSSLKTLGVTEYSVSVPTGAFSLLVFRNLDLSLLQILWFFSVLLLLLFQFPTSDCLDYPVWKNRNRWSSIFISIKITKMDTWLRSSSLNCSIQRPPGTRYLNFRSWIHVEIAVHLYYCCLCSLLYLGGIRI